MIPFTSKTDNYFYRLKYSTFDILQDDEVRQGLKKFSNWPTYPQLYVKGELIGGLDIVNVCTSLIMNYEHLQFDLSY